MVEPLAEGSRSGWRRCCATAAPSRSRSACSSPTSTRRHERRSPSTCARELPGVHVSASHEVLPRFREYERCSTTVIDAYLSPLLGRYLGRLGEARGRAGLPAAAGDAVLGRRRRRPPRRRAPAPGACSPGPAGGAVGAGLLARACGDGNALGFDMGGTSCDVCVVEGGEVRRTDSRADRRPRRSSCRWSTSTRSAPAAARSAGATPAARCGSARARPAPSPGPPATAAAAPSRPSPTPTSLLGYLAADSTLAGGVALDAEAAAAAVGRLAARARPRAAARPPRGSSASPTRRWCGRCGWSRSSAASTRAASRCCRSAAPGRCTPRRSPPSWGSRRILCPRASGVLSALGLCASERRRDTARTVMLRGAELSAERVAAEVDGADRAPPAREPRARPSPRSATRCATAARPSSCRSRAAPTPTRPSCAERFAARPRGALRLPRPRRRGRAGRHPPGDGRRRARSRSPRRRPAGRSSGAPAPVALRRRVARGAGAARRAGGRHSSAEGPGVFELPEATLVLPPGWRAEVDERRHDRRGSEPNARQGTADERARPDRACRSWSAACAPPATRWARC